MKQLLTILLALSVTAAMAQKKLVVPQQFNKNVAPATTVVRPKVTGLETAQGAVVSVPQAEGFFGEQLLGTTTYDLQSNSSMANRVHNWGGGVVSGTFGLSISGQESNGFPDRGTGYSKSDNTGAFANPATARIEAARTGFPSYCVTANGTEWVFSHAGGNAIHWAKKASGATTWTEGNLPTTVPSGGLWTRCAAGGPDGNTVHVIYLTTPTGNGGQAVDGFNGILRYWRSTNDGATWDIQDAAFSGITTDNWSGIGGDAYAIDAEGSTVALAVFSLTNDIIMLKSEDNGTTWNAPRIVHDFPLTKWNFDAGYTIDQTAPYVNTDIWPAPDGVTDSLAILTNDETGNVFVDPLGIVHVGFPTLFIRDPDTTDDNSFTWYPTYNLGIAYWNDELDDNAGLIVAYSPDLNGDNAWGFTNSEVVTDGYGDAFSNTVSFGLDNDFRLYMTYTSNHELAFDENNQHHKQPFIVRSEPLDYESWSVPKPVLDFSLVIDTILVPLSEYYFPVMAKNVDDHAHIIFQKDFTYGISLRTDGNQAPEENFIEYLAYPVSLITSANDVQVNAIDMKLLPNPATAGNTQVWFELKQAGETRVDVLDVTGAVVRSLPQGTMNAGQQVVRINTADLAKGMYFVRVQSGNYMGMEKLVVLAR